MTTGSLLTAPTAPKIYHITHLNNLASIIAEAGLVSDASRLARNLNCSLVGMSIIKERRLGEIEVSCHPGTKVGQYVPFYFCPRSVMLFILHRGNHPELTYAEGQTPIVHLEADFHKVTDWADANGIPWAFSDRNAGSYLTAFYNQAADLNRIDWSAVAARNFRDLKIKEGKQAEFLLFDFFPWTLVEKIGTINDAMATQVQQALTGVSHQPVIAVEPSWYF